MEGLWEGAFLGVTVRNGETGLVLRGGTSQWWPRNIVVQGCRQGFLLILHRTRSIEVKRGYTVESVFALVLLEGLLEAVSKLTDCLAVATSNFHAAGGCQSRWGMP